MVPLVQKLVFMLHVYQSNLIIDVPCDIDRGLSLDTAIIDLSTDVFGNVSNPCINEINHRKSKFRNDLPQIKKSKGKKR
uniref:Uncharacterized protein n=1 Tax=Amphimedon queenslandica TaxID=400682 RepID=A0A1X7UJB6_AMPQE